MDSQIIYCPYCNKEMYCVKGLIIHKKYYCKVIKDIYS